MYPYDICNNFIDFDNFDYLIVSVQNLTSKNYRYHASTAGYHKLKIHWEYVSYLILWNYCRYHIDTCNLSHIEGWCQIIARKNAVLGNLQGKSMWLNHPFKLRYNLDIQYGFGSGFLSNHGCKTQTALFNKKVNISGLCRLDILKIRMEYQRYQVT